MTVSRGSSPESARTAAEDTEASSADEDSRPAGQESAPSGRSNAIRRWARRGLAKWPWIVATTFVLAAVVAAGGIYVVVYRPDQRVSEATAHRAVQVASDGAAAVLSYSYDHLDHDFARAKSYLTGDFLAYYSKFTNDIVGPTAQQGQLTTTGKVLRAAVSDLHPDSAVVLAFIDQTTTSVKKKDPEKAQSAVQITLTKVDGSWRIAKFDPVA
jgi:Mce-associated membrane protein